MSLEAGMSIELVDLAFIVIMVVVMPLYGVWDSRRFKARIGAGDAGVKVYITTLVVEWSLTFAVAAWWYLANRDFSTIGLGFETEGWRWWVGGLLAVLASVFLAVQSLVVLRDPEKTEAMRKQYSSADLMALIPSNERQTRWWLAVSVTAAVGEEFRYRGFLMAVLSSLFNPWIALGLSTIAFGLGHLYQGASGFIKTGFNGLILGSLYMLTGSLWAPILFHFALDLIWGLLMRRVMDAPVLPESAS